MIAQLANIEFWLALMYCRLNFCFSVAINNGNHFNFFVQYSRGEDNAEIKYCADISTIILRTNYWLIDIQLALLINNLASLKTCHLWDEKPAEIQLTWFKELFCYEVELFCSWLVRKIGLARNILFKKRFSKICTKWHNKMKVKKQKNKNKCLTC